MDIRPSECWVCHVLFEEDQEREFRYQVFGVIRESGIDAARDLVNEHYAEAHAGHDRSWV